MVNIGKYRIIGENFQKHSHDTILTIGTSRFIANKTSHGIKVKQKLND
jgi:hypothetical protein